MADKPAGWFNDPYGRFQKRYFDGSNWTAQVETGGEQQVDPLGDSSVIPIAIPPTAFPSSGKAARVVGFLDSVGADSRERPRPSAGAALSGLGGAVIAGGVLAVALGDDPSRGQVIVVSLMILAAAWTLRMFLKPTEVQAAAVGMAVVAIPTFAAAVSVNDGTSGFWTGLLLAALFIAAWALPGFKSRNLLLGLGALALVGAFGSLTSTDGGDLERCDQYLEDGDFDSFDAQCQDVYADPATVFLPGPFTDNAGDQGAVYLFGGALYLGLTWWLDRRGHRGTGTAIGAAGLVSALIGTSMLASKFDDTWAPILVLSVGLLISVVGSHGERRATTWWGAALAAIGVVWFVADQWEPETTTAVGGVAIVAGAALTLIPRLAMPIRMALKQRKSS
ncbi:MAG: DUF2510 domain-containing protein [Actinobacteria bacterium]|nr:DUF2510 domain-containing protein [Actinomycetota bacterium]